MATYSVTWTIDIEADHPEEAAFKAQEIQCDTSSIATCYTVTNTFGQEYHIDLIDCV